MSRLAGRLAGIVTRSDLLRVYLRPGAEIRDQLPGEDPGADLDPARR